MVLANASTFSGSVVRAPSGGEGLPKVYCRRTSRFGHLCSQCPSVCGSSLHSGHVRLAAGPSEWAYVLRTGVCPDHSTGSRLQPLRGDPDNLLPEGTNATDKAGTPKARSTRPARAKDYACGYRRHHAVV